MSTAEALPSAEELKLCCASAYQRDAVALILGDSYHPGGLDLTRRLARSLDLRPGEKVLDVASGPGTTAFLLASEFGVVVVPSIVTLASGSARCTRRPCSSSLSIGR